MTDKAKNQKNGKNKGKQAQKIMCEYVFLFLQESD